MTRSKSLLLLAADAMDDGQDPFSDHFLSEHGVTLDECYGLGEQLALGARVLHRLTHPKNGTDRQVAALVLAEAMAETA